MLVPIGDFLRTWTKVALMSFGGPAGQISVMHRLLVEEKRWISEERFMHALNYCMLLPGPEAQQLATYMGWLQRGVLGGIIAGLLFILPGFFSILLLSLVYAFYQEQRLLQALFYGIQAAVLAIVFGALVRVGQRVLRNRVMAAIALGAFVAIFFLQLPYPLVIFITALVGLLGGRFWPQYFVVSRSHSAKSVDQSPRDSPPTESSTQGRVGKYYALRVIIIWLAIWWIPVATLWALMGRSSVYTEQALFFSKAAVVTFGGAYSVLGYIAQQAVETFGWLEPHEMLHGLGLAETTPGPLIQVVQFVGFMGAYRLPAPLSPVAAGIAASVITTWVTFAPCFLWILAGAPYIERLHGFRPLTAALAAITSAVVGVILSLSVWLALHTLFADVSQTQVWGVRLIQVTLPSFRIGQFLIALSAGIAMWRFRLSMPLIIFTCALIGVAGFLSMGSQ